VKEYPSNLQLQIPITILNFRMGIAMAATGMDSLLAASPAAVVFRGKSGGLKTTNIGGFILRA
jgi:hypothetical protein